nr:reverse transcriptase [Tanacetum cinerariifolium]
SLFSIPNIGRSKKVVFQATLDKIIKKLSGWKEKTLSIAEKIVLIRSVAQAMPMYIINIFLLPGNLIDDIHKSLNVYWWGDEVKENPIRWCLALDHIPQQHWQLEPLRHVISQDRASFMPRLDIVQAIFDVVSFRLKILCIKGASGISTMVVVLMYGMIFGSMSTEVWVQNQIIGMLISKSRNNVLYWHNNPRGRFSCKSAYLLALEADEDMDRTTISDDLIKFWRVVWKARVPSKVKLFMCCPAEWEIFMMKLWGLWTRRNKCFHDQLNGREGNVEAVAKFVLSEQHMANQRETTSTLPNTHTGVWLRPEIDLIKVNFDAAWKKESRKAGLGFVARDYNGEVLFQVLV